PAPPARQAGPGFQPPTAMPASPATASTPPGRRARHGGPAHRRRRPDPSEPHSPGESTAALIHTSSTEPGSPVLTAVLLGWPDASNEPVVVRSQPTPPTRPARVGG